MSLTADHSAEKTAERPAKASAKPGITMGAALQQLEDSYIPVKERLLAWWHGTPVPGSAQGRRNSNLDVDIFTDGDDAEGHATPWPERRIEIAEAIWGESFIEPGGSQFARKLIAPAQANETRTIMDLTAGLGGTAFTLARESNLWMEALEPHATLVERAREIARTYMLSRRVPIKQVKLAELELPSSKFDLVYSRERFFAVARKGHVLQQVARSLKKDGQLLITDFITANGGETTETLDAWAELEPEPVSPWSLDSYRQEFEKHGLRMRMSHDLSEKFLAHIHAAWHRIVRSLEGEKVDRQFVSRLVREGEIWLARTRALEAGDLQMTRMIVSRDK